MMKRLIVGVIITALLSAGCSKKHSGPANGSGATESGGAGGNGASDVTPSPAVAAAGMLATSSQQAAADAAKAFATAPVSDQAAKVDKLIDATVAAAQSEARDRSWDPASLIAKVGADRAKLFAWVHDQTALVPYTGMLRGAVGVMMDRVGNNLDRSLLLAELVKQAGGEARLAHATLDQANADKLAATWPKATRPAYPTTPEDTAVAANLIAALGGDTSALQKRFAAEAATRADVANKARAQIDLQAGTLVKMIEGTPVAATTDSAVLADHWWVQVKDGDAWTDLDLAEAAPGTSLVQATETMAVTEVPEAMQHTLAIRVIGEVWHDANREETMLVEHSFAPAHFYGQRLTITGSAVDLPDWEKLDDEKDRPALARAALISQTEWYPEIVMGATPVVRFSVTDNGELYDLMDPNGNSNRLARVVSKATKKGVGGATDMLEDMPDGTGSDQPPPPKPVAGAHSGFTAEWIEIEVRTPNAAPRIVRRTVFDELGAPADRSTLKPTQLSDAAKLDRGLAMLGEIEVLPQFARIPRGFVSDRLAKFLAAAKPAIVALVQNGGKPPSDEIKAAANTALPPPDELDELALERFASDKVFVDQIDVLTARRRLVAVAGTVRRRQVFDILANGVGAWGAPADARKARLAQGIADTVMESVLLPCVGENERCFRGPNTSDAFINAKSWSLVTSATAPAVAALPADARVIATNDLANGYAIVLAPDGKPATWWRVRSETGELLGQGAMGGNVSTETLIIQHLQAFGIGAGLGFCAAGYRGVRLFGCVVAVGLGAASFSSTGILAAGLSLAATIIGGLSTTTFHGP